MRSRKDKPLQKLEQWLEGVWWPSTAGRVPKNILVSGAGKADQWRNLGAVLIPGLYECWQIDGEIPDAEAPRMNPKQKAGIKAKRIAALVNGRRMAYTPGSKPTVKAEPTDVKAEAEDVKGDPEYKDQTSMTRNYREHFDTICEWQSAIRIWSSQSITVAEARRAQDCHNRACQAWARMGAHLTPYFHLLSHLKLWILRYGPLYAQWGFPFEQKNGWLSKLRHNGHQGGELESTMLRGWIKLDLVYELISWLENLSAQEKTREDEECIRDLKECLRGGKKMANSRGTLLTTIAAMSARDSGELIVYPKHGQAQSLRGAGLYHLVFAYLAKRWRDDVTLIMDTSFTDDGIRYGASTRPRGVGNRYAYMNGRQAVQIDHILRINYNTNDG
ncbi:hypothetical protein C8T65DRAFT_747250 [Cerioporus squamosus]|nr:hypothetical protein C8T65DRAFT_747250 [Cerioporus squamosus]